MTLDETAIDCGMSHLARWDALIAWSRSLWPDPAVRPCEQSGLTALIDIVVGQQISVAAADSVRHRLRQLWGKSYDPSAVMLCSVADLRRLGLSGNKAKSVLCLAQRTYAGALDFAILDGLDTDSLVVRLCQERGIGPWSATIYALLVLGHGDAFPAWDMGLRQGYQLLQRHAYAQGAGGVAHDDAETPTAAALFCRTEHWQPWRGVGALYLWSVRNSQNSQMKR